MMGGSDRSESGPSASRPTTRRCRQTGRRLLHPAPRSRGARAACGIRDVWPSRLVLRRHVQRAARSGYHPSYLPVSPATADLRAPVRWLRYTCAVPACLRKRPRSPGGQRRQRNDHPGRRIHADAGDFPCGAMERSPHVVDGREYRQDQEFAQAARVGGLGRARSRMCSGGRNHSARDCVSFVRGSIGAKNK